MDEVTKRARTPDAIAGEGSPLDNPASPLVETVRAEPEQWEPVKVPRGILINVVEDVPVSWTFEDNPDVSAMVRPATPGRVKFASMSIEVDTGTGRMSAGSLYDSVVALARACLEGEIEGVTVAGKHGEPDTVADFETIATHCPDVLNSLVMFARKLHAELDEAEKN